MKFMVIENFVVPVLANNDAGGELYETDMADAMVVLAAAQEKTPKLLSIDTLSFVDVDREKLEHLIAKVNDHPAMEMVAKLAAEYSKTENKTFSDILAGFSDRASNKKNSFAETQS